MLALRTFARRTTILPSDSDCRPISVLKPLKGIDDDLERNLRTFFEQDYPSYELLFAVNDLDDPAIPLVRQLMTEYPNTSSSLIVSAERSGLNPKVNNLVNAFPSSRHELLLISDSNVAVDQTYLRGMIAAKQDNRYALVTSMIRGNSGRTFGAHLENLHMNTFVAGGVLAAGNLFRVPITIGKSMMISRDLLIELGGFASLGDFLAEDHELGRRVLRSGRRVTVDLRPINNVNRAWTIRRFLQRHLRWGLMRRHVSLLQYLVEPISNPIALSLLFLLVLPLALSLQLIAVVVVFKVVCDGVIARLLGDQEPVWYYLLVPLKDLLMQLLWVVPLVYNRVEWRGNRFVIGPDTKLFRLEDGPRVSRVLNATSRAIEFVGRDLVRWIARQQASGPRKGFSL